MENANKSLDNIHPGKILNEKLIESGYSQREVAAILGIAHSHLNDILNGKKNINPSIAISLEAIKIENAIFWLNLQMVYQLNQLRNDSEMIKKNSAIEEWNSYVNLIPVKYFKNQGILTDSIIENIKIINDLYGVTNTETLKNKIDNFNPVRYRKSSAFAEESKNVLAWEVLAAKKAHEVKVKVPFDPSSKENLVLELNANFNKNKNTLENTAKILSKYGIKFIVLDRPDKTPVDGKTFKLDESPAICLTLKYKRLDNFAYTIMHELGHVFLHLTNNNQYSEGFYSDVKSIEFMKEELEADKFATDNLIPQTEWENFYYSFNFTDDNILRFSQKIKVHPAIIRGRICYLHNEYYQRRTKLNALNVRT